MSDKQKIPQFWDKGVMLVTGCAKVSPGCKNCWSEKEHHMRSCRKIPGVYAPELMTDKRFNGKVQFNLRLLESAAKVKKPHVYAIWNDLYHPGVTDEQIVKARNVMDAATQHTILIVTKRPERAENKSPLPSHIWHIVTCENQAMADKRIPHLLRIPGKRGLIIEPMLGEVNLMKCAAPENHCYGREICETPVKCDHHPLDGIHQVILGPENGTGKRPFMNWWADSVKAQCMDAGVPFYRKDTGEGTLAWRPAH